MRDNPPDSEGDERDLGGPGWEKEEATDYNAYLDGLTPDEIAELLRQQGNEANDNKENE